MSRIFGVHLGSGPSSNEIRNFVRMVSILLDGVGARIHIHVLINNELLTWVGFVGVDNDRPPAMLRQSGHAENVSFTLGVHIVAGLHGAERLQRFRSAGLVPDAPQGAVFLAKPPERKGL